MSRTRSRRTHVFLLSGSMVLTLCLGCSGNQNEDEFLRSAPPGKPSEFPNESFAQRKQRTLTQPNPASGGARSRPEEQHAEVVIAPAGVSGRIMNLSFSKMRPQVFLVFIGAHEREKAS